MMECLEKVFPSRPAARYTLGGEGLFVPGRLSDIREAMEAADLEPGESFLDLGSGDGRVVCMAALMGCQARGIEEDTALYRRGKEAELALKQTGRGLHIEWFQGNLLDDSFEESDVIFYYAGGCVSRQKELYAKLEREMHPGARLIVFRTARDPGLNLEPHPNSQPPKFYIYSRT